MNYLARAWHYARWPLGILVLLFIVGLIWRAPYALQAEKSREVVAEIQSQRLTEEHVDGKHLPPPPDPAVNDSTIEGIDSNANGIRDDVELAIFEKYSSDKKVRAAELQYAMALQTYLTKVFSTDTWEVSTQQTGRAYGCIFDVTADNRLLINERRAEVEALMLNTSARLTTYKSKDDFQVSFEVLSGEDCDQ